MADTFQEAPFGQLVRLLTRNKFFKYPEEDPNFQLPWEAQSIEPVEAAPEPIAEEKESDSSSDSDEGHKDVNLEKPPKSPTSPVQRFSQLSNASPSKRYSQLSNPTSDLEKAPTSPASPKRISQMSRQSTNLEKTISTPRSLTRRETHRTSSGYSVISRRTTREQTSPFSQERFEVEQEEAVERQETNVIQPQKTSDGIILVDWYTTDDPANPQNWSPTKKFGAALNIFFYTFVVYCASAIYTSSELGVMERFVVGQSKASLGLSMFVLGYGIGPLIFSPLSEIPVVGRNIPYITSFGLFVILSLPTALVDNYAGLLVLRFLTGFMGSPCLATGGATMGDIVS